MENKPIPDRETASHEEKKRLLFRRQKKLLDTFLKNGAITKEQYEFSLNGLITKMGITDF